MAAQNKRQPTLHEKWEQDNQDFKQLNEQFDTPESKAKRERILNKFRKRHKSSSKNDTSRSDDN